MSRYIVDPETGRRYPIIAGGTGIEEIAAIAGLLSATAGIGTTVAKSVSGGPKAPSPAPAADTASLGRAVLPGAKADAAARTGGGISPEFLANLVGQQSGEPSAGLDVIGDIRRSLGQQGA